MATRSTLSRPASGTVGAGGEGGVGTRVRPAGGLPPRRAPKPRPNAGFATRQDCANEVGVVNGRRISRLVVAREILVTFHGEQKERKNFRPDRWLPRARFGSALSRLLRVFQPWLVLRVTRCPRGTVVVGPAGGKLRILQGIDPVCGRFCSSPKEPAKTGGGAVPPLSQLSRKISVTP